jgi:cysteinyl-tRNA synthetase
LKIYNTLTRTKEEFIPIKDREVGFYSCGLTVYDWPHIGNLRAYIFADTLHRWLEFNGYKVKHVVNITDVGHLVSDEDEGEDKLLKGARREGKTAYEVARFYEKAFLDNLKKINVEKADVYPRATEHIKEQIDFIEKLEKKGFTYIIDDGVYFDTSKLKDYGKLAGLDLEGLKAGARIEINPQKKNISDFALWKFSLNDVKREMEWDSPWGKGFPGWHIECSAMSCAYLGEYFDIHSGGIDHIPVHHTNEIAQSEAVFDKPFVKYWVHNEFLLVNGRKMSKSLNNFYTLRDLEEKFKVKPLAYRILCLQAHYRDTLNFTQESIKQAQNTLNNLNDFVLRLKEIDSTGNNLPVDTFITETQKAFAEALDDDLNSPKALAALFDFIKEVNKLIVQGLGKKQANIILDFLYRMDKVLGLGLKNVKSMAKSEEVDELFRKYLEAKANKHYEKSDKLRTKIQKLGWTVEDSKDHSRLYKL